MTGTIGYTTCAEFLHHTKTLRSQSAELEFTGPVCNLRDIDLGIAVAGVLIDEAADQMFTSDRAAAQVCVYRCSDEQLLARVTVGPHPNGLAFDPSRRQLFSFNLGNPAGHGCTASVVSLDRQQVVSTIPLPGRPRWAAYDPVTGQVFVNIRPEPRGHRAASGPAQCKL
jgi:serine/threonine protein kinase, bacterial